MLYIKYTGLKSKVYYEQLHKYNAPFMNINCKVIYDLIKKIEI